MGEVIFSLKAPVQRPLDTNSISPDSLAGKSLDEVKALEIWRGNRKVRVSEVFDISGEPGQSQKEVTVVMNGDLSSSRRLGEKMTDGSIVVNGSAGLRVGEEMKGGSIVINGDAGSWLGVGMKGGSIEVKGSAGDHVGSGLRGTQMGMSAGSITVAGNAGWNVGRYMTGGTIRIGGDVGQFAGGRMKGGTMFVQGNSDGRPGASMVGGKVIVMGKVSSILPGFKIEDVAEKAKAGDQKIPGPFYTFVGDGAEKGNGKLFISVQSNPHLKYKEAYTL